MVSDCTATSGLIPHQTPKADRVQCLIDDLPSKLSAKQRDLAT